MLNCSEMRMIFFFFFLCKYELPSTGATISTSHLSFTKTCLLSPVSHVPLHVCFLVGAAMFYGSFCLGIHAATWHLCSSAVRESGQKKRKYTGAKASEAKREIRKGFRLWNNNANQVASVYRKHTPSVWKDSDRTDVAHTHPADLGGRVLLQRASVAWNISSYVHLSILFIPYNTELDYNVCHWDWMCLKQRQRDSGRDRHIDEKLNTLVANQDWQNCAFFTMWVQICPEVQIFIQHLSA